MVTELAKITNNFEITQNLTGEYEVSNYQLILDTLQAYAENIDEVLIVTTDENSVNGAKATKKEFKEMKEAIEKSFETFMKSIEPVTKARLDFKRVFTKAEANIDAKIKDVYVEWIKEALFEYGRHASIDVTYEMLDQKAFARKQTKKSIYDAVENEVMRIEAEYAKEEEERQTLIKYCKKAGQPYEAFIPLLGNQELNDVLKAVDKAEEQQKEREKAEEERRKQQEEQAEKEKEARETIIDEIVPTLEPTMSAGTWTENTAERKELWTIQLWLNDSEKELLKQFLTANNIKIESVE